MTYFDNNQLKELKYDSDRIWLLFDTWKDCGNYDVSIVDEDITLIEIVSNVKNDVAVYNISRRLSLVNDINEQKINFPEPMIINPKLNLNKILKVKLIDVSLNDNQITILCKKVPLLQQKIHDINLY